jgi:hypothetical protein
VFAVLEFLCEQAEGQAEWFLAGTSQCYERASKARIKYRVIEKDGRDLKPL